MRAAEGAAARASYLEALSRDRNDLDALLGLAAVYLGEGDLDAACTVAARAVTRHADCAAAHLVLGTVLLERNELAAAHDAFGHALRLEPRSRKAWAGTGVACERSGQLVAADTAWRMAFAGAEPAVSQYRGDGEPVRVLLLWSAVDGNVPLRPVLDDRIFQWSTLFVESFGAGVVLPPHAVVVNAVGNADLRTRALDCAELVVRATRAPVVNLPERVRATGRVAVAELLRDIPNVITARIVPIAREVLLSPDAARFIASAGLVWPLLVRSPGYHTGEHFAYVGAASALGPIVAGLPGDELLVIAYIDTRRADGAVRKYRVLAIDGRLHPLHLAISADWKVHYFSADPRPEYRAEERAFLDDMPGALGADAVTALERVAAALGLDYAGIDFTLDAAGRVVVFEANATMAIVPPGDDPREDYRRAPIGRAIDAVRAMIAGRAG